MALMTALLAATLSFPTWDGNTETARFAVQDPRAPLRTYTQTTTLALRDPGPQSASYTEDALLPRTRTGSLAFDALFALAGHELRQDAVHAIRDDSYNGGAPISCECFETGEKWHYVWTRDLAYAADLGIALLDPERVRNGLLFKLSGWRAGVAPGEHVAGTKDGVQIVQDTGSGGSWPVSTDRVAWAFAAEDVLQALPAPERGQFAAQALAALANTLENDRLAAFDAATGLYTGEQSFLDWREQTYAAWIAGDLPSMASAKALSTNVAHYKALTVAARLARAAGDAARGVRYDAWARDLKRAINDRLWLDDAGMYSSLTAGHFDGAPLHKFDWLGQSLAIVTGVADEARTRRILASYPHGPMGAPVIWPQQPGQPVYHNRAIWPFVTAYGLRAAIAGRNVAVADAAYDTLMRGAALNLSNMENLEWLTGQPMLKDDAHPELAGPVISSRRQLWSVGAYLGMVVRGVFGVSTTEDGIRLDPFVTRHLASTLFAKDGVAQLAGLRLQGHALDVRLHLPGGPRGDAAGSGSGYYAVERITVNGKPAAASIPWQRLRAASRIDITLGRLLPGAQDIRRVTADPYAETPSVFGPREPDLTDVRRVDDGNALTLAAGGGAPGITYNVWRDGQLVASGLAPSAFARGPWIDRDAPATACYALEAVVAGSGNRSHHSRPRCAAPDIVIDANTDGGADTVRVPRDGRYALQVDYHNGANQTNLGISGGVKWLAILDAAGKPVAQGVVQLPHTARAYSTPVMADLQAGATYRIRMGDFYNMSYLQSNSTFSAAGGVQGPSNRFDIHGLRLQPLTPPQP